MLRHSAATAMLRHGVSLPGVCAVLRHTSPQMTIYLLRQGGLCSLIRDCAAVGEAAAMLIDDIERYIAL
jgi:hypothetical protein